LRPQLVRIWENAKEKKYILLAISAAVILLIIFLLVRPFSSPKKAEPQLTSGEIKRKGYDLYRKGKYQRVVEMVEKYLKTNESDFQARSLLVSAYLALDKTEAAYKHAKYLYKLRRKDSFVLFRLANLADQLGETTKAIEYMEKALAEEPDKLQFHTKIASLYSRAEKYEEALKEWQVVLDKLPVGAPYRAQVYEFIGDIYTNLKQPGKARQAYQESLKVRPDNEKVTAKLNKLTP
jgi:tetratricopeptide (TPR) repeat protein